MGPLRGSLLAFVLYDVAEQIQIDKVCALVGAQPAQPGFKHPAQEYVRFERPPAVEIPQPIVLETGDQFQVRIKYFDYGVISIELMLDFEVTWTELVQLSNRWLLAPEIERRAAELMRSRLERVKAAMTSAHPTQLSEDYYVIHLKEALGESGRPTAPALVAQHGVEIAQIVRGESQALSDTECAEVLHSSLSYYPNNLLVTGWAAALVYDTPEAARPTIQLLEYANTQLLEFRHYDEMLTRVL